MPANAAIRTILHRVSATTGSQLLAEAEALHDIGPRTTVVGSRLPPLVPVTADTLAVDVVTADTLMTADTLVTADGTLAAA